MSDFGSVLAEFKSTEAPENIFPLLNDVQLCNAIIAWKSISITYKPQAECEEKDEQKRWEWLWTRVSFDVDKFGIVTGCKAQDASRLFIRLQGLRLIYPDGTLNVYARQYLGQLIVQKVSGRKKNLPQNPPPAPASPPKQ